MHSGIDRLIFPGMNEDPGWTFGSVNSAMPAFGPIERSFRSFARFMRFTDSDLSADEKFRKSFMLFRDSGQVLFCLNEIFVAEVSALMARRLNAGSVFMPFPTAVPPIPKVFKYLLCA